MVQQRFEDEPEIDEDVQLVNKGDVHCIRCNKDFPSTLHLKNYVKLYHKNVYKFKCQFCDIGFQSMKGLREHQKIHKGSKLKCSQCEKDFTTDRAMKWHIKEQHSHKGDNISSCKMLSQNSKWDSFVL